MRGAWILAPLALLVLGGCPSSSRQAPRGVADALVDVPEEQLLDVGIEVFDPGIPELSAKELEEEGIFPGLRRAEARFIPFQLAHQLQASGRWGAVRVVPRQISPLDLVVAGRILRSTGKDLELDIRAVDASGRVWLDERYEGEADPSAYDEEALEQRDPYHALYTRIAWDLAERLRDVDAVELRRLRQLARLRFAADIAPQPFDDYLERDKRSRWSLVRLPAEDDPMLQRVAGIRDRDQMLVDTLNEHYANFYAEMLGSYEDWRRYSYEEQKAYDELKSASRWRGILGGLAIAGAIFTPGDNGAARAARDAMVLAGAAAIKSAMSKAAEAKIHQAAIKELSASFDSEVAPMVVEVEDRTLKLTGSAEEQYQDWRQLLREIFATESGLPLDPNASPSASNGQDQGAAVSR